MKTGSDLLRTLAIAAAKPSPTEVVRVPISREEAEELLRLADLIDSIRVNPQAKE